MVRDYFNRRASTWESGLSSEVRERGRSLVLSLGIRPGSQVLDVGCGTGVLIPWLAEAVGCRGCLVAMDIAEKMLKEARSLHPLPELEFVWADAARIPFPGGSFDEVVCHNCYHLFHDGRAALQEMRRILRPGGRIAVSYAWDIREVVRQGGPAFAGKAKKSLSGAAVVRDLEVAGLEIILLEEGQERFLARARKADGWVAASPR